MTLRIPDVFGLFTALLSLAASAEPQTAARPNVIFVLCDDLGPGDLGALWQNGRKGKQKFSTPNMDQFAKEGMILSRHYCPAPSCMASRSSLMMGRHQGHCVRRNTQFDAEIPDVHTLGSVMSKAVARLHDALLIDADSQYTAGSKALSGKIALRAGLHPLRINCLAPDNAPALSLEWQVPGEEMKPMPNTQFFIQ